MRYAVKQRLMAFGDDFDIRDDQGAQVFFVDGKAFSFGHDLSFRDRGKNELARITQKLFTLAPVYKIQRKGQLIATVRKALFSFRPRFYIDVPGQNFSVIGNPFRYEYKFYRNRSHIGTVSKKILAVRDSYGVDIADGEDEVLLLSCAIVIDMVMHNKESKYNR